MEQKKIELSEKDIVTISHRAALSWYSLRPTEHNASTLGGIVRSAVESALNRLNGKHDVTFD